MGNRRDLPDDVKRLAQIHDLINGHEPKTLLTAIKEGMEQTNGADAKVVMNHVKNFLAQKFGIAMMTPSQQEVAELIWNKIFPGDV